MVVTPDSTTFTPTPQQQRHLVSISIDADYPISIDIASTPQQLHLVGSGFVTFTCQRLSHLVVTSDSTALTPTPQQQHRLVGTSTDIASTSQQHHLVGSGFVIFTC